MRQCCRGDAVLEEGAAIEGGGSVEVGKGDLKG